MTASDPALDVRPERPSPDGATPGSGDPGAAGREGTAGSGPDGHADDSGPGRRRRRRVSKWEHPPPKDWRWWVSGLGKTLIATGLLMFAFVAYQLWGTAIETARAQRALEDDFATLLAETPPAPDPVITTPPPQEAEEPDEVPTVDEPPAAGDAEGEVTDAGAAADPEVLSAAEQNLPVIEDGDPVARLEIPRIGVDHIVVAGVSKRDLQKGPGHYPDTPLPGQLGNSAIAGHRTTYGQPFYDIDQLEPGDDLIVTTLTGRYVYVVTGQQIVAPSDYEVVATVDPTVANLTLTSCHPRFTAQQRIVVASELDVERSGPVGEAVIGYGRTDLAGAGDEAAATADPATTTADPPTTAAGTGAATPDAAATAAGADVVEAERTSGSPGDPQDAAAEGAVDVDDGGAPGADAEVVQRSADETDAAATAAGADVVEVDDAAGDDDRDESAATDGAAPAAGTAAAGAATTDRELADAFAEGWFSDPGAPLQVALWGTVVALIGLGAYLLSRATRRDWVGALVGIAPFVVALYFFFQNVNRLLPPNL